MLESIKEIDKLADGDVEIFLELLKKTKEFIKMNPDMLYRRGWK